MQGQSRGGATVSNGLTTKADYIAALARDKAQFLPDGVMIPAIGPQAALKRDGWAETRRSGSHRVLLKGNRQRVWAYHDGVDLGGPAMARIAKDYGYSLDELRKL